MHQPGKVILAVADHPRLLGTIRRVGEGLGLSVVECSDGMAARERLATLVPDLVLCDLVLPESSGFELCELIRASPRLASVLVLVMSGRAHPGDRAHAFDAGADGFLAKPFTDGELRASIEAVLAEGAGPLRTAS